MKIKVEDREYEVCTIDYSKDVKEFLDNFADISGIGIDSYYLINNFAFRFRINEKLMNGFISDLNNSMMSNHPLYDLVTNYKK